MRLCLILFALFFLFSKLVNAQVTVEDCNFADNTADIINCVNARYKLEQERLAEVYKNLAVEENKDTSLLAQSQKSWLSHRDKQCAWEKSTATSTALEKLYELSCLRDLTTDRANRLLRLNKRVENEIPLEFTMLPRWVNVLAHDYPKVFWNHGDIVTADLDCDGTKEHAIAGIAADESPTKVIVSIIRNVAVGRPEARIFKIPVGEDIEDTHLCNLQVDLALTASPEEKNTEEQGCKKMAMQIADRQCKPIMLYWKDKSYFLQQ